ncbi:FHA domain-containing protein [Spongiibacter sp.]|uniref:FHA domain-containing protein n=1 Tax=Spongiibacter sp. TaxID=2024860 RepID=UPI003564FDA7
MSDFHLFEVVNAIDHELPDGETVVGRSADCDIRLLSSSVSRKHGVFTVEGEQLRYTDLGSSNGSFVNGQAINKPTALQHGDAVIVGEFQFSVTSAAMVTASDDAQATQLSDSGAGDVPAMWSENAGLEQASGTELFADTNASDAVKAYREGRLSTPPLADTARLVGLSESLRGEVFELRADGNDKQNWNIGRDANRADLQLNEASVSGQHAQLARDGARWKIVNWMSTNGTFVNDQKGLSTYLKHGDIIRMGSAELAFELPQPAADSTPEAAVSAPPKVEQAATAKKKGFFARLFGRG